MNASFSAFSNNLDDVRDHWERVKLFYEILIEPRTRRRYDRHEMLSDPGAAIQRSALDAVGKGFAGVGKIAHMDCAIDRYALLEQTIMPKLDECVRTMQSSLEEWLSFHQYS